MLSGRNIVLGVTGSIAAYKAADLASCLVKLSAQVQVVMTWAAEKFISSNTFETLTGRSVITSLFNQSQSAIHIELAKKSHALVIYPATANIIAKIASGISDDPVSTIASACYNIPIIIAPAMNERMWQNSTTQANVKKLSSKGFYLISPEVGFLACGQQGVGRLASLNRTLEMIKTVIKKTTQLSGKKVLVTAGATREPLDPARYLSSPSTGKMGFSLARELSWRGAKVTLISASSIQPNLLDVDIIQVGTAGEMASEVKSLFPKCDILFMVAAVSDYRFSQIRKTKLKRDKESLTVKLKRNPDILSAMAKMKKKDQIIVGFAAETEDLIENSQKKLREKKLDMVVGNYIGYPDSGFASETNKAVIVTKDQVLELPLMSKDELAAKIVDEIVEDLLA